MKLKIEELRAAFDLIDNVPQIDTIESSRFIRCVASGEQMELHLNSTMFGFAEVSIKEGSKVKFYLERSALSGFLKAATGDEITLQVGAKHVLQQGRNKLEISTPAQVAGYTTKPTGKADHDLEFAEDVFGHLRTLHKYVPRKSVDERYSALQGIKGLGWIATDGLFLTAWKTAVPVNLTIPSALWQSMTPESKFRVYGGTTVCQTEVGMLGQPIHADLAAFPLDRVKTATEDAFAGKPVVEVETEAWLTALRYFESFAADGARIECEFSKSQLLLRMVGSGIKAETIIAAKVLQKLEPLQWDLSKLRPWSGSIASKVIRIAVIGNITAFTSDSKKDLLCMVSMKQ